MNVLTFNAAIAAGVALSTAGAWAHWGASVGLMVAGALLIALTLAVAYAAGRSCF